MSAMSVSEDQVIRAISPNDEMFNAWGRDEASYHAVGRAGLDCVLRALDAAGKPMEEVHRVLDLPCGHGRVLRYLRAAFPEAEITACDLLRDGVDYCAATFGAVPVHSHEDPVRIPLERNAFDLIWVGSLLTHLDAPPLARIPSRVRQLAPTGRSPRLHHARSAGLQQYDPESP